MPLMLDEIRQQPAAIAGTLRAERAKVLEIAQRLRRYPPSQVIIGGRATSLHAGLYGKVLFETMCGLPASIANLAVYTMYRRPPRIEDALVIGISQSGEATDVITMLQAARKVGALTLGITNEPSSPLAAAAEYTLLQGVGRERAIAATKTYTGTLACLLMLAVAIRGAAGLDALEAVPPAMEAAVKQEAAVADLVKPYRYAPTLVTLGRGYNEPTAHEAALKVLETCYLPTRAWSPAEFMHGPFALVAPGLPFLAFALAGRTCQTMVTLLRRLKKEGAELIVVSDRQQAVDLGHAALLLSDGLPEYATPLSAIIPAQFFACYLAQARGHTPDHPRNLQKVTRTR